MIEWLIAGLFLISIILFIFSFITKDPYKKLEQQIESNSIQMMQEMYFLKKKVRQLEEEILTASAAPVQRLTRNDILELQEEGYAVEEITKITGYSTLEVENLLDGKE